MSTEQIYDEQIAPLLERVSQLCRAHNIPYFAAFQVRGDTGTVLRGREGAIDAASPKLQAAALMAKQPATPAGPAT